MGVKVHTFSIDNELFDDTRVPFQYRGGSKTNERRAFELSALFDYIREALEALDEYDNDDAAAAALGSGKLYWGSAGHDRLAGALFRTP